MYTVNFKDDELFFDFYVIDDEMRFQEVFRDYMEIYY
jgi:hypothetical protein